MEFQYDRILASPTFKFIVGPEKRLFTAHKAVIIQHSKPLARIVDGPWAEAKESCAFLEDVDPGTFVRFVEFAYRGNYTEESFKVVPGPTTPDADHVNGVTDGAVEPALHEEPAAEPPLDEGLAAEPPADEEPAAEQPAYEEPAAEQPAYEEPPEAPAPAEPFPFGVEEAPPVTESPQDFSSFLRRTQTDWEAQKRLSRKKRSLFRKSQLRSVFQERDNERSAAKLEPRQNLDPSEDYTPVFLCHAQVYSFADKYDISPLRDLALNKLHLTLCNFKLYPERYGDVIELLRYTYSNTVDREGDVDGLRKLGVDYMASEMESLATSESFNGLLRDAGELGRDLVLLLLEKLG